MDFTLTTEQKALRDALRDMLGRREPADRVGRPTFDAELWEALAEMGLLALPWEDEEGAGPVEVMVVAQELGRARAVAPYAEMIVAGHLLGDDDLLAQVGTGETVVVPVLTEPGHAWGTAPTVTAQRDGESDGWLLEGTKGPVPYADGATHAIVTADVGVLLLDDPQVSDSVLQLSGTSARLVTGDPERLTTALSHGTLTLCAEALGAMESALALTVDYLKSRKQFGVPLMSFQALTQRAAVMYTEVELARSAMQYAAMVLAEPESDDDAPGVLARTAVVVGKAGRLVGEEAVQLHGGIAVTAEYAVGHLLNRLTAIEHTFGDTRHHLGQLSRSLDSHDVVDVL
jgi:alkylation response protein AidB-like acyl-CoA dehydrogenase